MKKYIYIPLAIVAVVMTALVASGATPWPPWFNRLNINQANLESSGMQGRLVEKKVRFHYKYANDGGAVGAISLGASLPQGATIVRSYIKIITQPVSSSSSTVAIHCDVANNIISAVNMAQGTYGDGLYVEGVSTGTTANFKKVDACTVKLTIGLNTLTAGEIVGWVAYVNQ